MIIRLSILIGALLVLGAVNILIFNKEQIKSHGEIIFIDLAPRDPRSIMQGDYMTLRFNLGQEIEASLPRVTTSDSRFGAQAGATMGVPVASMGLTEGEFRLADIALDEKRIATLSKTSATTKLQFRYRIRKGQVWLGTNAFFFQEGDEPRFANARYGEFRVDAKSGEAVLVGLRDAALKAL